MAQASSAANHFRLEVELKPVFIFRPWLDTTVFTSHNWWFPPNKYPDDNTKNKISYGTGKPLKHAQMPIITNIVYLARNLKMYGDSLSAFQQTTVSTTHASAGGSFGCFSAGGSADNSKVQVIKDSKGNVVEIDASGVQIIGYSSSIVPETPNFPGVKDKDGKVMPFSNDNIPPDSDPADPAKDKIKSGSPSTKKAK